MATHREPPVQRSPRGRSYGSGPNDFQVNKTAEAVGVRGERIQRTSIKRWRQ